MTRKRQFSRRPGAAHMAGVILVTTLVGHSARLGLADEDPYVPTPDMGAPTITSPDDEEEKIMTVGGERPLVCTEVNDYDTCGTDPEKQDSDSVTIWWDDNGGGTYPSGNIGTSVSWVAPQKGKYVDITAYADDNYADDEHLPGGDDVRTASAPVTIAVVGCEIAGVQSRGPDLPDSLSPGDSYDVLATVSPSLTGTGHAVHFSIEGEDGVAVCDTSSRTESGPVTVRADCGAQTSPAHALGLRVVGRLDANAKCGESPGFSVCAHPNAMKVTGGSPYLDATWAGMLVDMLFRSDSGTDGQLDEVEVWEEISASFDHVGSLAGYEPTVEEERGPWLATELDVDAHITRRDFIVDRCDNHGGDGAWSKNQLWIFACRRCGMTPAQAVAVPDSGYQLTREIDYTAPTCIDHTIRKSPQGCDIAPYTTGPGPSASCEETVRVRD